jgi:hypothetical protein
MLAANKEHAQAVKIDQGTSAAIGAVDPGREGLFDLFFDCGEKAIGVANFFVGLAMAGPLCPMLFVLSVKMCKILCALLGLCQHEIGPQAISISKGLEVGYFL